MGEAESATGTPRSTAEPQLKAAKDKNCPFCGQAFTSSSLGRHLDLYIRAKNPKAPDGIHVVEEIRKLRGGITRRQAKGSVSTPRRDDSGTSTPANKKRVASDDSSMHLQSPEDDDEPLEVGKTRHQFKDVSWGNGNANANGNRGPSRLGTKTPDPRRDASRQMRKADLDQRYKTSEESEIASATEMALRELLKSVREANAKSTGCGLFDFDPYTQNFPALCLQVLPAPATLFSPTPFPTSESWGITPPGQKQFEALNKQVRERLLAHQRQRQINQVYPPSGSHSSAPSTTTSPLPTPPLFDPDPQRLFGHIADAYNHWTHQSEQTRQECWQIEILRCYARADYRRGEAEVQLENARREIEYLKANRWTSGATDMSPISINLGTDTARELAKHGMDYRNWDYDRLIEKWRTAIRENKASTTGMAGQRPLPGDASSRSCSMASQPPQAFAAVNQPRQGSPIKVETSMPFTAPPTVNGDDHVDAEGDDDDDEIDLTPHTLEDEDSMHQLQHQASRQSVHQPQQQQTLHSLPAQPTPPHPSQQLQPHTQTPHHISQAQANAQAQAWAAAHQHMNQCRNQDFRPHQQHQQHQLSPHVQHIGSASSSRRPSLTMMDPHSMNQNSMNSLGSSMGMSSGMDGMDNHADQFLRLDMGMSTGFVGSNDGGVSMAG